MNQNEAIKTENRSVQENGFIDEADRDENIRRCVIKSPAQIIGFQSWQLFDGTKAGLVKLNSYPKS